MRACKATYELVATAAHGDCAQPVVSVVWNGAPFSLIVPPIRQARIVRILRVAPNSLNPPSTVGSEPHVLMREHHVELVSADTTILIISNAPEAEFELPDHILTAYRDIGTFRDATIHWRGREDHAFVSVSLTEARFSVNCPPSTASSDTLPAPQQLAALVTAARGALRTGLIVTSPGLIKGLSPDEIEFANLLIMYRDQDGRVPYTYDELGKFLGVSRETVRRRHDEMKAAFPHIGRLIAAFRARNNKGDNTPPPVCGDDDDSDAEDAQDD